MAKIKIEVEVPDEIMERVRAYYDTPDGDEDDDTLWEDAEDAVINSIRATFTPHDLRVRDA